MIRIHKLWPSLLLLAGLLVLFIAERLAGSEPNLLAISVSGVLLLVPLVVRAMEWSAASAEKKPVARLLLISTAGVVASIAIYGFIRFALSGDGSTVERVRGVLWAVFPIVLVCSAAPLLAIEAAVLPVAFIDRYENVHVKNAAARALGLALFLSCLFALNYLAVENDEKVDLSRANQTTLSDQTRTAVRELTEPVKVVLFWPKANSVADTVTRYFEPLVKMNPNLTLERVDHALASKLAKDTGVTENGYVALIRDQTKEKFRVGTEARSARSGLRRLDKSFLEALLKVATTDKVAYFTIGHEERSWQPDEEDTRPSLRILKRQLEAWQYQVRPLGVADGLTNEVPKDAGIIFIMGPEKPFLEAEVNTLAKAVERGARIFIALEGEREGDPLKGLLDRFGLSFDKTILANETKNAPVTHTPVDATYIWSNKYSSHESVTTMTRNQRLATLFYKSGSISKAQNTPPDVTTEIVIRAMEDTFQDVDGNFTFEKASEKKDDFGLAAAVTRTSTTGRRENEGRLFVLSDVDVMTDDLLQISQGNAYLLRDIAIWLQLKSEPVVPTVSEADLKIEHRKEDDIYVFYGTTVGIPLLVFAAGFVMERRRRRS